MCSTPMMMLSSNLDIRYPIMFRGMRFDGRSSCPRLPKTSQLGGFTINKRGLISESPHRLIKNTWLPHRYRLPSASVSWFFSNPYLTRSTSTCNGHRIFL